VPAKVTLEVASGPIQGKVFTFDDMIRFCLAAIENVMHVCLRTNASLGIISFWR